MELMPATTALHVINVRHPYKRVEPVHAGLTCRQLSEAQVLHGPRGDQRFLRVVQHMS